jgi:hypothetical protein
MTRIYAIISRNQSGLISRGYLYANGHKNAEYIGYQSADNPRLIYEMPLHDITAGVWCTVNTTDMPGTILSSDTINTKRCTLSMHTKNNKNHIQTFHSPVIGYNMVQKHEICIISSISTTETCYGHY